MSKVRAINATTHPTQDEREINEGVIKTIVMLYEYYGFQANYYSIARSIRIHNRLSEGMSSMKYWKYRFAAFFSYWKQQSIPKSILPKDNMGNDDINFHVGKLLYGRGDRFVDHISRKHKTYLKSQEEFMVWPSFLQSILMLKKGLQRPVDSDVIKGLMETFRMLSRKNKITSNESVHTVYFKKHFSMKVDGTMVEDMKGGITLGPLFRTHIRKVVAESFSNITPDNLLELAQGINPRLPSSNANYVSTNNEAGTLGLLYEMFKDFDKLSEDSPAYRQIKHEVSLFRNRWGYDIEQIMKHIVIKRYYNPDEDFIDNSVSNLSMSLPPPMLDDLSRITEEFSYFLRYTAMTESPKVKLIALKEALKVRVISKGPPITYYALKPLQKLLHGAMRKTKFFRYVGMPVSAESLYEIIGPLNDRQQYVSGDYKDATNNMHPLLGSLTVNAICDYLNLDSFDSNLRPLMHKALTGHQIENPLRDFRVRYTLAEDKSKFIPELKEIYKFYYKEDIHKDITDYDIELHYQPFKEKTSLNEFLYLSLNSFLKDYEGGDSDEDLFATQLNGQLMGSPMSFIVLCIVNGALIRAVDHLCTGRDKNLQDIPATFNGDDFVYKTTSRGYKCWQALTYFTGMEESVGKTFFSREFLNMNSREYLFLEDHFVEVPFINLGLIYGFKRSQVQGKDEGIDYSMSQRITEALLTAPIFARRKLYDYFLNYNIESLRSVRLPWFVPAQFGGLGLPVLLFNGDIYNWEQLGFPSTLSEFKKKINMQWHSSELWSDFIHQFGKTLTYPTYKNLCGLRGLLTWHTKEGVPLIEEVKNISDPVIYNIHKAIMKFLPPTTLIDYEHMERLRDEPQTTASLQLIFFLFSLFLHPIELKIYNDDERVKLIKKERKKIFVHYKYNKIALLRKEIPQFFSLLRESNSFFELSDPLIVEMNMLKFAAGTEPLYHLLKIFDNEAIWEQVKDFKLCFDCFIPKFQRIPYQYTL